MHVDTWRAAYRYIVPEDHLAGLSHEESERLWQKIIEAGDGCVFVAEDGDGVFGFASGSRRERFSRELREYEGELKTLYILPSHQGAGAGGQLVGAVARHFVERGVNSMLLWVFADNPAARGFYESLGGVVIAEDGFEISGVWLTEVAYGWKDLNALLAGGGSSRAVF